jgi:hypothetical protein
MRERTLALLNRPRCGVLALPETFNRVRQLPNVEGQPARFKLANGVTVTLSDYREATVEERDAQIAWHAAGRPGRTAP